MYLGPAEGQADDMPASEMFDDGFGQNAISSRGAGGWVKLMSKRALDLVVEVSDAFPPLKGAAAGLKYIVENVEVNETCPFDPNRCHLKL